MITISIQYFGGRGSSSGRAGKGGGAGEANTGPAPQAAPKVQNATQSTDPNAPNYVSKYTTGGKIVDLGGGHWEAENDNGSGVSILDGGKSDLNLYKFGSKQIYTVTRFYSDAIRSLVPPMPVIRASTKAEAMREAKKWIKQNKNLSSTQGLIAGT